MRAGRDSPLRAEAIGIDVKRVHWLAFAIAGGDLRPRRRRCSPSPRARSRRRRSRVGRSVDGLVMVLLGGVQTLTGPIVGAVAFTWLQDTVMRADRVLARAARRHHPAAGAGCSRRASSARSSSCVALPSAASRSAGMSVLSDPRAVASPSAACSAVDDVELRRSQPGELLALIGPNGAGKSTCFNMINGQLKPDAGEIQLDGREHRRPAAARRSGGSASAARSRSPRPSAR